MDRLLRVVAIIVVVAAIGVGAFFAGRETAPTTSAPPTTATTTTSAPSTTSPPSTTEAAICQPSQLDIVQSGSQGAAGTIELTFSSTNISTSTCTMYGYPGMLLLSSTGAPLPTTVMRGGGLAFESVAPTTVSLAPEQAAYFNVGYSDVTAGATTCSTASQVEITPPTDTAYVVVSVPLKIFACDNGLLHVSVVFGSTDTAATQTTAPS